MKIIKRLLDTPPQTKGFQGWSTTYNFLKKLVKLAAFAKQIGVQMVPSPLAIIGTYVKFSKKLTHLHMFRSPSQLFKIFSFATLYTSLSCWLILCTSTLLFIIIGENIQTKAHENKKHENTKTKVQEHKNNKLIHFAMTKQVNMKLFYAKLGNKNQFLVPFGAICYFLMLSLSLQPTILIKFLLFPWLWRIGRWLEDERWDLCKAWAESVTQSAALPWAGRKWS